MSPNIQALVRYALDDVGKVEGWLHKGALTATILLSETQRRMGIVGDVGEIGVHHGRYFILLSLLRGPQETAVAIDLFEDQHLNIDGSGKGDRHAFGQNLRTYTTNREQTNVIKANSLTMSELDLQRTSPAPLRLFSIDGGHTVAHALNDLALVESALHEAGIVVIDDFFNPGWPGVNEGLFRYWLNDGRLRPFLYGDNKVFLTHRDKRNVYCRVVQDLLLLSH